MSEHRFDAATSHCQRCGIQKGSHAEECEAPENLISLRPYLAKRAAERGEKVITSWVFGQTTITVEAFPPPESA